MTNYILLEAIKELIPVFYKTIEFWITVSISLIGILISIFTLLNAKKAKEAADQAKKAVTIKNVESEINDIVQKLNTLPRDIKYERAKEIILQVQSTIFRVNQILNATKSINKIDLNEIEKSIEAVNDALLNVRPDNENSDNNPYIICNGIEKEVKDVVTLLSKAIGKLQANNINQME